MKVQCDVCQHSEATVLCCADEATLCSRCDEEIHAANKLASKHQRMPLYRTPAQHPTCDICQEKSGFFFCLEDRALLCHHCDSAIHNATQVVSAHRRFLVSGVRVELHHQTTNSNTKTTTRSSNLSSNSDLCYGEELKDLEFDVRTKWQWNDVVEGFGFEEFGGFDVNSATEW